MRSTGIRCCGTGNDCTGHTGLAVCTVGVFACAAPAAAPLWRCRLAAPRVPVVDSAAGVIAWVVGVPLNAWAVPSHDLAEETAGTATVAAVGVVEAAAPFWYS